MLDVQVLDRLCRAPHLSEVVCIADDSASSEDDSCSGGLSDPLLRFSHVVHQVRRGRLKSLMELDCRAVHCPVWLDLQCSLCRGACRLCVWSMQQPKQRHASPRSTHSAWLDPCRLPTCVVMCGRNVWAMRSKDTPTQIAVRAFAHINNMPKHFRPKP